MTAPQQSGEADTRVPGGAVLIVVELAFPATMPLDRAVRPAMCAEAGIPSAGGVELLVLS
jgi:hypothetical protein